MSHYEVITSNAGFLLVDFEYPTFDSDSESEGELPTEQQLSAVQPISTQNGTKPHPSAANLPITGQLPYPNIGQPVNGQVTPVPAPRIMPAFSRANKPQTPSIPSAGSSSPGSGLPAGNGVSGGEVPKPTQTHLPMQNHVTGRLAIEYSVCS